MSLTAVVAANVILDIAILSVLAWVMFRPARLRPHGETLRGLEFDAERAIAHVDRYIPGQSAGQEREAA